MKRQDLVDKLTLAGLTLANNAMVPVLQCFMFTGSKIIATDGAVGVTIGCKTDEAFAVHGATLLGLLYNSSGDEVDLDCEGTDVVVKAGRSTFKLPYITQDDFIELGSKAKNLFNLPLTEGLLKGVEACLMTASSDATKAALCGLTIRPEKTFHLFTCDGDAITRYDTGEKCQYKGKDIMLPLGFCESLVKIAKTTGIGKGAALFVSDEWAHAVITGGYDLWGTILNVDNPLNHDGVITRTLKKPPTFVKLPEGLKDALTRAWVVAKPESNKTVLTVEGGKLKLLTTTPLGIVRDSVGLSGHPDVTAQVNAELMLRSISICQELAITDRCVAYRSGEALFQIISNVTK